MKGLPEVLARRQHATGIEFDLHVPPDCVWFDGHFPGRPILPGVVHVGWAMHFAAQAYPRGTAPRTLKRVKFKLPILPGARLVLRIVPDGDSLAYDYLAEGTSMSSGVLCLDG